MDLMQTKKTFVAPSANPTQHTIFEVILLVVVCGLFYWFLIAPKSSALGKLNDNAAALQKESDQLTENKMKLQKAIADLKAHPEEVAELDEALPLDNRVTKLYIALSDLTSHSGMTVGDIGIATPNDAAMAGDTSLLADPYKNPRSLQKLVTSLDALGTFDQFQALLQQLENSGRLINITGRSVAAGKDALLDFKINLEAYYYE